MKYLLPVFAFVLPFCVSADVRFSEIYYDAEGSDAGFEWVEVHNTGASAVDLSLWKFREGGTAHNLVEHAGGTVVGPDEYAVIADNPTKFNSRFSTSGVLFDSSFSLSNEGELLELLDEEGNIVNSVTYDSSKGGAGDGNSLSLVNNVWKGALPTPGEENSTEVSSGSSGQSSVRPTASNIAEARPKEEIVLVNTPPVFSIEGPEVSYATEPIDLRFVSTKSLPSDALVSWNFGDGSQTVGKRVAHIYAIPGTYVVVATVKYGDVVETVRAVLHVVPHDLVIELGTFNSAYFVEIQNRADSELDLHNWSVDVDSYMITLPPYTYVLPDSSAVIPLTGVPVTKFSVATLITPDGNIAATSEPSPSEAPKRRTLEEASEDETVTDVADPEQERLRAEAEAYLESLEKEATGTDVLETQVAAPLSSDSGSNGGSSKTTTYLAVLLALGALGGLYFYRTRSLGQTAIESEANEYEIIEEE